MNRLHQMLVSYVAPIHPCIKNSVQAASLYPYLHVCKTDLCMHIVCIHAYPPVLLEAYVNFIILPVCMFSWWLWSHVWRLNVLILLSSASKQSYDFMFQWYFTGKLSNKLHNIRWKRKQPDTPTTSKSPASKRTRCLDLADFKPGIDWYGYFSWIIPKHDPVVRDINFLGH